MNYKHTVNHRLRHKHDIDHVFGDARAFKNGYTTILTRYTGQPHSRLTVITSRKKLGKANRRVRLKRLTRESFRHWRHKLDQIMPLDIVVIIQAKANQLDNQQWFETMGKQWQRVLNFYKKHSLR